MIKSALLLFFCCWAAIAQAQNRSLPLQSFYKNSFVQYSGNKSVETFFPANENQLALYDSIQDTAVLYVDFHQWLFKKNWLELHHKDYSIRVSPIVNFSYGKAFSDQDSLSIYRNTRGLYADGQLFKNWSFQFFLVENQARFMAFENAYYNDRGEIYTYGGEFHRVNAVIPGAARTKAFKGTGFDYAFSIGSLSYQINPKMRLDFGNNQHFIGSGYRSLLLSDNSIAASYLRFRYAFAPKWTYQLLIRKQQNLFRKPFTKSIEAVYESKFFSAFYLTYKPSDAFSLSLFSAGNQLRQDSIVKHPLSAQMLIPLPGVNTDLFSNATLLNGIAGLNLDYALKSAHLYGQLAIDKLEQTYLFAAQAGSHFFKVFGVSRLNLQVEYNYVPQHFYANNNPKLAYSHYNLPSAHPKGNDFHEIMLRGDYGFRRFYLNGALICYVTKGGNTTAQLAQNSIFTADKSALINAAGTTFLLDGEFGYRFNRMYNPNIYAQLRLRSAQFDGVNHSYAQILVGLKVSLFNQYTDF